MLKERFLSKVNKTENCWEWRGAKRSRDYGNFNLNGKPTLAHRVSYELFIGKIPKDILVCHRCDNQSCVNPNHLFLGTQKDNVRDCLNKGRMKIPTNFKQITHGTLSGYDYWKCRCKKCKLIKSVKNKKREHKRKI